MLAAALANRIELQQWATDHPEVRGGADSGPWLRPKDAFGRHVYDPADYGWTYPGLAEEFEDRCQVRSEIRA